MQENKEQPNYYAIIPANVRYDDDLRANAKLLFGEIIALTNKTGICYASNSYFAKLYKVNRSAVSKWLSQLKNKGYIVIDYLKDGEQIKHRVIRLIGVSTWKGVFPKEDKGCFQKSKENNTSINNIDEYKKEEVFDYDWMEDDESE